MVSRMRERGTKKYWILQTKLDETEKEIILQASQALLEMTVVLVERWQRTRSLK
jgi:hypothetical protein